MQGAINIVEERKRSRNVPIAHDCNTSVKIAENHAKNAKNSEARKFVDLKSEKEREGGGGSGVGRRSSKNIDDRIGNIYICI